jgi:3-dehydroquinate synthetase
MEIRFCPPDMALPFVVGNANLPTLVLIDVELLVYLPQSRLRMGLG